MLRLGIVAALLFAVASAEAEPPFLEAFKALYHPTGALRAAECLTCHVAPPVRNPFGRAVDAQISGQRARFNAEVLKSIEPADSDGDGWSNGDEIHAGFLPGDPNSHPTGSPSTVAGVANLKSSSLLPTHAFHPLIVHFPIALFLFGVFLDVLGARRKDPGLRRFALWNLGFGAISAWFAVATGLTAFLVKGFSFQLGLPLTHLLFGASACVLMSLAAWMKRADSQAAGAYWLVVGLAAICTTIAGHLGATIVYG